MSWRQRRPAPGWNVQATALANPRTPAVPATLEITLEEYFTAAAMMGILAAQDKEPDQDWVCKWAERMGTKQASHARRKRQKR